MTADYRIQLVADEDAPFAYTVGLQHGTELVICGRYRTQMMLGVLRACATALRAGDANLPDYCHLRQLSEHERTRKLPPGEFVAYQVCIADAHDFPPWDARCAQRARDAHKALY
jgi:hypothetical protein